ncbi:PepSY-associated TM helix domain-containing protein [Roseomonas populi]|uniref:PepSY domain-containing protein n=1 Tax=Roseomonas populi TaxID=3121582 RepID=A0ABT1XAQ7_9PROT|nr:PepSY-associated TM helix domain-containing protein [Roseomonas pecuniae]MCR0985182.1 PepSY domain-containing protein [Roseomonas pecuniae]
MKEGFRQSMAWLHSWAGLLVGWILFAVFLTGTAAYLRPEISYWMRPELALSRPGPADAEVAVKAMQGMAPNSPTWFITLPSERETTTRVFWREGGGRGRGRGFREAVLDPATGHPVEARETMGGEFFYRFHFQLHYMSVLWGRWIVSICAMFMLVAIVSGIITHRRIFADFFTFRPGKGQRSWLDGHNVCAVLALPYHLMITYTGLVLFMLMVMPWGIDRAYPGGRQAFNAEAFGSAPPRPRANTPAPLAPVLPLVEEAQRRWEGGRVGRIVVANPGDANATIQLVRADSERISYNPQSLTFDGPTGALIQDSGEGRPAAEVRGWMYGLHIGRFAGPFLRGLFLLSGLAGTVMVATGCVLWAVKMRQQAAKKGRVGFGTRLVEHLNIAAIAGLPLAMAAFLWANRLLPVGMEERAAWEVHVFFIIWGLCFVHPLFRRGRQAWVEQFAAGAAAFALLPALNALVTQRHLLATLAEGDIVRAGFDLGLLACAALLGVLAWKVARHQPATARARRPAPKAALMPAEAAE